MKIALFGVGQMGSCIAHLISTYTDHELVTFDKEQVADNDHEHVLYDASEHHKLNRFAGKNFNIVLSSLPYFCNESVANLATAIGIPYFDLGGSVEYSEKIKQLSIERGSPVFTDLGLAPGWANIMAEEAYEFFQDLDITPYEIKMRCGGLPQYPDPSDPFMYYTTWSTEGLWNEYMDDCEIVHSGEIESVESLYGLEQDISFDYNMVWGGKLEAFYTSGGASHSLALMKNRGVRECSYKTLRYPGHRKLVHHLLKDRHLEADELQNVFRQYKTDTVILDVVVRAWNSDIPASRGYKVDLDYRKTIQISSTKDFSAMQLATSGGFLAAVLASSQSTGNSPMDYSQVDTGKFYMWIDKMNILQKNKVEEKTYV